MTRYIAYTSTAHELLRSSDIDHLLLDARAFNARIGVTGVLLYDGLRFFQYFEGSDYATDQVMSRIRASGRHRQIQLLADAHRQGRELDRWYMGFSQSPASFIQHLENCNWQQTLYHLRSRPNRSPALDALNAFLARQPDQRAAAEALMNH